MPVGDGGEGTLEALTGGLHLKRESHTVTGAFGQPVEAYYATNGRLAVFENGRHMWFGKSANESA